MNKMRAIYFIGLTIIAVMLSLSIMAAPTDTTGIALAITSSYTITMLFGLSIMGIALHWFVDLRKAQNQDVNCTVGHYAKSTWASSVCSLIICCIAIMIRHELNRLPNFSAWEGGAMVTIGYMGDSLLPLVFGFAKSKGINTGGDN